MYQLFAPPVPLTKHVLTGAIVSETLPGESAYVEGTDAGIVIPMTPFEVDRALRIWLPPRVRLYVVLGVKPEPSKAAAAELVSWKPTFPDESPVARRLPTEPVQAARSEERRVGKEWSSRW